MIYIGVKMIYLDYIIYLDYTIQSKVGEQIFRFI